MYFIPHPTFMIHLIKDILSEEALSKDETHNKTFCHYFLQVKKLFASWTVILARQSSLPLVVFHWTSWNNLFLVSWQFFFAFYHYHSRKVVNDFLFKHIHKYIYLKFNSEKLGECINLFQQEKEKLQYKYNGLFFFTKVSQFHSFL